MRVSFAVCAAVAALCIGGPIASADEKDKDDAKAPAAPASPSKAHVLVFGDGVVRLRVERDASGGRMTFHLADSNVRLESPPVIVTRTEAGPKEITLTAVAGQPGMWVWTDDLVKADRFDGTMRVVVEGRTYTTPLASVWTSEAAPESGSQPLSSVAPRHGGSILAMPDCGASVEIVQDRAKGTLTVYGCEGVSLPEAPVVSVTQAEGPATVTLTRVEGQKDAWEATDNSFRSSLTAARIHLNANGQACDAPLVLGGRHGGQIVMIAGGPTFEIVSDSKAKSYTFYAVEDTVGGRTYTLENPTVVVEGRTYNLTRVEGEPRAWRLVGLDAAGSTSRDAQLNFTLFGKTLSTKIGLSGLGVDVK